MGKTDLDVIVVGAGIAGLVAARELKKRKQKVCVLEARNRVGGRIYSIKTPSGKVLDLGAQWVGEGQNKLKALLDEFSIETFPDLEKGENILYLENKFTKYTGTFPSMSLFNLIDLYLSVYRIEKDCVEVPSLAPYNAKNAEEWDGMTVETWGKMHIHTKPVRDLLRLYVEAVYAASPRDLSLLFFLSTLHDSHGFIYGVSGASAHRVEKGLGQVCEQIANTLKEQIILNSPVRKIVQSNQEVIVTTNAETYRAKKVVMAIPPTIATQIQFDPPLPPKRDKLNQRMPMGSAIKTFAIYRKPFWRAKGLSGKVVTDSGLVRLIYDASPLDDSCGILLAFLLGSSVIHIDRSSETWLADNVIATLTKFFGEEAKEPEEFVFYNWNEDLWARGGYAGYMPPGVLTELGKNMEDPNGNIYWAGTEVASRWHGYVEGAIESAHRVVGQICKKLH